MLSNTKFVIQEQKFDGDEDLCELEHVAEMTDAEGDLIEFTYENEMGEDVYISFSLADLLYAAESRGAFKYDRVEEEANDGATEEA